MKIGNLEVYGVIYKVTNKINSKVYIGQTTNKRGFNGRYAAKGKGIERMYNYYLNSKKQKGKSSCNEHLFKSIKKYGFDNFEVNKEFDIAFSFDELNIKEKLWIKYYNSIDEKYGYNILEGGSSFTKDDLKRMGKNRIGKFRGSKSPHAKKVICLNTKKIYNCILDAEYVTGINHNSICSCCKNGLYTTGNTSWMYYEDYIKSDKNTIEEKINKNGNNSKAVICLNDMNIFNSAKEAGLFYDIVPNEIINCCQNKTKKTNNKIFMYYKDFKQASTGYLYNRILYGNSTTILCLNDNKIYESYNDCGREYNISNVTVKNYCLGKTKLENRILFEETGEPFQFKILKYNEDVICISDNNYKKQIICNETGDIFNGVTDCENRSENVLGVKIGLSMLASHLNKNRYNTVKGYTFKYIN